MEYQKEPLFYLPEKQELCQPAMFGKLQKRIDCHFRNIFLSPPRCWGDWKGMLLTNIFFLDSFCPVQLRCV